MQRCGRAARGRICERDGGAGVGGRRARNCDCEHDYGRAHAGAHLHDARERREAHGSHAGFGCDGGDDFIRCARKCLGGDAPRSVDGYRYVSRPQAHGFVSLARRRDRGGAEEYGLSEFAGRAGVCCRRSFACAERRRCARWQAGEDYARRRRHSWPRWISAKCAWCIGRRRTARRLEGMVTFPAGYDAAKKYPFLVLPHGGPEANDRIRIRLFFAIDRRVWLRGDAAAISRFDRIWIGISRGDLPALRRSRLQRRG